MINRDGLENNDHWETPEWLYKKLNDEFNFDFDPCPFIQKAFDEYKKGKTCVLLIPAATGTKQFHELILPHAEIRFLKGRIAFKGLNTKGEYTTTNKGKHDSMIVIFRSN